MLFVPRGHGDSTLTAKGVEIYELGEGRVDLAAALARLADTGIARLMVEGGGSLNFELLRLHLVDEVQVCIAPLVFGGATAPTLADGEGLPQDLAITLRRAEVEALADGYVRLRYLVDQ
jgi:riboflavin biosynthesis pyrimidine reductase